ncbi:MAG: hypothetical protein ACKVH8_13250 [Pirellulales bacterium]
MFSFSCTFSRLVITTLVIALVASASSSYAQKKEKVKMSVNGTILDMRGNLIQIKLKDADPWVFQINVKPQDMQVNGTAEPGWVQPGMYVSFTGQFDEKGISQAPVSSLSVFTIREEIQLGVTKVESAPDFINGASEEAPASSKFEVLGKITGKSRDGKLTVAAGRTKIAFEFAEDAAVTFGMSDPSLIRKGDKIEGDGWYYEKGKGIMDLRLTVTSAEPFKGPEEKKRRTTTKRTTEKKTEEAAEADKKERADAPLNLFDKK